MEHNTSLIATLAIGFSIAWVLGFLAERIKVPALVGYLIAGIIVGFPDDTRESIRTNMRLFRQLRPDAIYAQYLTPYPKTRLRDEMLAEGLVDNVDRFSEYDGFSCNVHTRALDRDELFRLLKAEAMRFALRPSHLLHNYFLRHYPLAMIKPVVKIMGMDLYNVLTGRRYSKALDV